MNGTLTESSVKEAFERDGYVVLRNFLSQDDIAGLWREIERYRTEIVPHLPATEHLYEIKGQPDTLKYLKQLSDHDSYFKRLFEDPRFVGLAKLLLRDDVTCHNISLFNKPPRVGDETPPHQDGFYFMLEPMEALTFWLALDPVDAENGCVRYVPGSHLRGMRPHRKTATLGFSQGISDYGEEDVKKEEAIVAQPGDLLIHHCMTIHRADPNRSNRTRHALGMIYYAARAKENKRQLEEYQKSLNQELASSQKI